MGGAYDAARPTLRAEGKDSCSRTIPREPEHRKNDMEDTKSEDKPKGSNRGAPELGTVTIEFNPGPDAQDRLRRLFTLLVEYATRDKVPPSEADLSLGDGSEDEG